MSHILECDGLIKTYGRKIALDGVTFSLERGRIVGLLGPNGSGKTTLLKLANGLLQPTRGRILIDGKEPGLQTKGRVSYLPDANYLPGRMNVQNLLDMYCDFFPGFDYGKGVDMLAELHIKGNDRLKTLSRGNKEKVQLVLAMSRRADIYFLDEPIGGVDPAAREYILNTIIRNYSEESTVLLSTHLVSDIEQILDEAIFLNKGELICHRSVEEIRETEGKSVDTYFREVFRC